HQAQAARSYTREAAQPAECRDRDLILARNFQNGLILARAHLAAVDGQSLDSYGGFHACTSSIACNLHAPEAQPFPTMWSSYSARKYRSVLSTGLGAVWPNPQRLVL